MNEQWSSWIHQPTPLVVFRSRSRCRSRFGKPLKRKPLKPGATSSNQWGLGLHNRAQLTPDLPCWPGTSWEKGSLPLRLSSQPTPFLPLLSLSLSLPLCSWLSLQPFCLCFRFASNLRTKFMSSLLRSQHLAGSLSCYGSKSF